MDSKIISRFKNILLCASLLPLAACTYKGSKLTDDENIIGKPMQKVSALTKLDGSDSEQVAIFDDITRRIHQFRLSDMTFLRSLNVENPESKHSVVAHEKGNYVIDLYDQHLKIFQRGDNTALDPISLSGTPVSVAFRSDLNLFVIYDNLNSVGILQLDADGSVIKKWVGGSLLATAQSITSGDLLATGQLVLSLSNDTLALVDVTETLNKRKWVFTTIPTSMTRISWIAPIFDNPNQLFIRSDSELVIFDLVTKSKVATQSLTDFSLEKLSKSNYGHVVARAGANDQELNLFYAQNGVIENRKLQKQDLQLLSSQLNLAKDEWSFADSPYRSSNFYNNNADQTKLTRRLKMFQLSDMLATKRVDIADRAQIVISSSSLFQLFPSDLGYASRYDLATGTVKEAKFFNLAPAK